MKSVIKPLLLSVLLASAGFTAIAQPSNQATMMRTGAMAQHRPMDPAAMQQRMAQHQAELKTKLGLNAAQEGAWTNFVAAMQPPPDLISRMNRENRQKMHQEMRALTTPERIDRMTALRAQRQAEMDQRHAAIKAFYAALTPEQQKVFDANTLRDGNWGQGKDGGPGMGHRHG